MLKFLVSLRFNKIYFIFRHKFNKRRLSLSHCYVCRVFKEQAKIIYSLQTQTTQQTKSIRYEFGTDFQLSAASYYDGKHGKHHLQKQQSKKEEACSRKL